MIEIKPWIDIFLKKLQTTFAGRIVFVGLQGSYGRGEATEGSDIDVVVILDELTMDDLQMYSIMLEELPHRELVCGFISGREELLCWEPSDLFQFFYDTMPIIGNLDALLAVIDNAAIERAIHVGACNIYHACVHNMVHEKNVELLRELYKSAVFVIQALHFQRTGRYVKQSAKLCAEAEEPERGIVRTAAQLKDGRDVSPSDFWQLSTALFQWTQDLIQTVA